MCRAKKRERSDCRPILFQRQEARSKQSVERQKARLRDLRRPLFPGPLFALFGLHPPGHAWSNMYHTLACQAMMYVVRVVYVLRRVLHGPAGSAPRLACRRVDTRLHKNGDVVTAFPQSSPPRRSAAEDAFRGTQSRVGVQGSLALTVPVHSRAHTHRPKAVLVLHCASRCTQVCTASTSARTHACTRPSQSGSKARGTGDHFIRRRLSAVGVHRN